MKMKNYLILFIVSILVIAGIVFAGVTIYNQHKTNIKADLNCYVVVYEDGISGSGRISKVVIDYDKLLEDYEYRLTNKNLKELGMEDKTPKEAAKYIIDTYEPFLIGYEVSNNLKNDDYVRMTWKVNEEAIEMLSKVINIDFGYHSDDYHVRYLKEVQEVDPFTNVRFNCWGTNGEGSVSPYAEAYITSDKSGETLSFMFDVFSENDGSLSNGDIVYVSLRNGVNFEELENTHGIIFTRIEAYIAINGFAE